MRVAVLPFSTAEGVPESLGRQAATYLSDNLRTMGGEIYYLPLMAQVQDQAGKNAFVNLGDSMMEKEQLKPLFENVQCDLLIDGMFRMEGDEFHFTNRFTSRADQENPKIGETQFKKEGLFQFLSDLLTTGATAAQLPMPEQFGGGIRFGSDNADVFMKFLEGADALSYIQQAKGQVIQQFNPAAPLKLLVEALEADPNFEGPYVIALELARICVQYRIGAFVDLENALQRLTQLAPRDYRAWYVLAEIHMTIGEVSEAAAYYEKALELEQNEPSIYTKLAIAQMNQGMMANAERNLRRALEKEGPEKPSLPYLCNVLVQTNRNHEIPALWKERIDEVPNEPAFHAQYAYSLMQSGREEEGEKAFEHALGTLQETFPLKRFYAPILAQKGEVDRAMDFYEDCLDVNPTDIGLMMEYARTLQQAGRDFEIPPVLRNVLSANPDPNTAAQANAWLIELEQPKRVEVVEDARKKVEEGDFEGAIRDLKPLRNWMTDYWKFWAVLANCFNHLEQFGDAEDAAGRLVNLMPGYEAGYAELMRALSGQQKFDQAYNAMKWATMNIPQSLPISLNYGLAAKQAGHVEEARALAAHIRTAINGTDAMQEIGPVLDEMEK